MYITQVISYRNAWDILSAERRETLEEIQSILTKYNSKFFDPSWWGRSEDFVSDTAHFVVDFDNLFKEHGWGDIYNPILPDNRNFLGSIKNDIAIDIDLSADTIANHIYFNFKNLLKEHSNKINLPILVRLCRSVLHTQVAENKDIFKDYLGLFEDDLSILNDLTPLSIPHAFLVLGLELDQNQLKIIELSCNDDPIIMDKCITFEPEYYQAGLGILSYFGTVLREKYPGQNATVKIEQQDLTVRMIVESENGNQEIIEKALHEYQLVISGQTPVEDFYPTAVQTLELKNKIRMLNYELETQREISALKDGMILDLRALAHQALSQPQPNITVINQLHNEQNIKIDYKSEINQSYEALDELIDLLSDESIKNQLRDIQNALDNTRERQTPEEIQESSGFKKLGKFLRQAKDASSNIHGILENTDNAVGVIEKLTKHYEKLVQFCQSFIS